MIVVGQKPRTEVAAMLESRGLFNREYRIRVRLTRFRADRIDQTYGAVTEWHRSKRAARREAMRFEVPKQWRAALATEVSACH